MSPGYTVTAKCGIGENVIVLVIFHRIIGTGALR